MKTFIITFALLAVTSLCCAQPVLVESQVIDAVTKEPLVGASVYAEPETGARTGTISNTEGAFSFSVPSQDETISVVYLGYAPKAFKAGKVPAQILLTPISYDIKPALVVDKNKFIRDLYGKYSALADKSSRSDYFFYRQITTQNGKYTEILEAILNAESKLNLDKSTIVRGRYAKVAADSTVTFTFTNFFYLSQICFLQCKKAKKNQLVAPLNPETFKYYDINVDLMFDEKNNDIYIVHFVPKANVKKLAIKGDLYVDPASMKILRYVVDTPIPITVSVAKREEIMPMTHFVLDFDNDTGIPTVRSVVASMAFSYNRDNIDLSMKVSSLLVRTNEEIVNETGKKLSRKSNLLNEVSKMKDDPEFWRSNQIIKRTPLEEDALKMFEEQNLVGTYTTPVQ